MTLSKNALKKTSERVLNSQVFAVVAPVLRYAPLGRSKKNLLLNMVESARGEVIVKSRPYRGVLNLTNSCNLRCSFCEIHYVHTKFPKIHSNIVDLETFKKFDPWLKTLYQLEFFGSIGEPRLNPDFAKIVEYVKDNYGTRLFLNTNGTMLNCEMIVNTLINYGFDDVLVSLHAANEETYRKLIGGDFKKVLENVRKLVYMKRHLGADKPLVGIAFALNKCNAVDVEDFVNMAASLGVDYIAVTNYYHVRNKFTEDISYFSKPNEGNALLTWMYQLARAKGIMVVPEEPPYINRPKKSACAPAKCREPWRSIKFEGCLDYENSHYVTVCNRINIFRVDYTEFDFNNFGALWNHPVLQYMRRTVGTNLLCAFCKSGDTAAIRCTDNEGYRELRDKAICEFLAQARNKCKFDIERVPGLYLLDNNPYR